MTKQGTKLIELFFSANPLANSFKAVGKAVQNAFKAGILSKFTGAMKKVGSGVKKFSWKIQFFKK